MENSSSTWRNFSHMTERFSLTLGVFVFFFLTLIKTRFTTLRAFILLKSLAKTQLCVFCTRKQQELSLRWLADNVTGSSIILLINDTHPPLLSPTCPGLYLLIIKMWASILLHTGKKQCITVRRFGIRELVSDSPCEETWQAPFEMKKKKIPPLHEFLESDWSCCWLENYHPFQVQGDKIMFAKTSYIIHHHLQSTVITQVLPPGDRRQNAGCRLQLAGEELASGSRVAIFGALPPMPRATSLAGDQQVVPRETQSPLLAVQIRVRLEPSQWGVSLKEWERKTRTSS